MHLEQDAQKQLMPGRFGSHSAPQPRVASSGALPAGRAVRCHAAWTHRVDALRMHALDRAVSTVNGVLSKHTARDRGKVDLNTTDDAPPETVRQRGRAAVLQSLDETMGDGGAVGATAKAAASSKMIVLEAKTSVNRPLQVRCCALQSAAIALTARAQSACMRICRGLRHPLNRSSAAASAGG